MTGPLTRWAKRKTPRSYERTWCRNGGVSEAQGVVVTSGGPRTEEGLLGPRPVSTDPGGTCGVRVGTGRGRRPPSVLRTGGETSHLSSLRRGPRSLDLPLHPSSFPPPLPCRVHVQAAHGPSGTQDYPTTRQRRTNPQPTTPSTRLPDPVLFCGPGRIEMRVGSDNSLPLAHSPMVPLASGTPRHHGGPYPLPTVPHSLNGIPSTRSRSLSCPNSYGSKPNLNLKDVPPSPSSMFDRRPEPRVLEEIHDYRHFAKRRRLIKEGNGVGSTVNVSIAPTQDV